MLTYAHDYSEWVRGEVIPLAPISAEHDALNTYLGNLLQAYLELRPVGAMRRAPFVMQLDVVGTRREPDIQVILTGNPGKLTDTAMVGPADLCIEIVSPESTVRDHGEKLAEYEQAGVREYWIIDPRRKTARFNRLDESGAYSAINPDADGHYHTPLLPGLQLDVATLWRSPLPGLFATGEAVRAMLPE